MKTLKKLSSAETQQVNGGACICKYWEAFKSSLQDIADRANPWVDHSQS